MTHDRAMDDTVKACNWGSTVSKLIIKYTFPTYLFSLPFFFSFVCLLTEMFFPSINLSFFFIRVCIHWKKLKGKRQNSRFSIKINYIKIFKWILGNIIKIMSACYLKWAIKSSHNLEVRLKAIQVLLSGFINWLYIIKFTWVLLTYCLCKVPK